MTLLQDLLCPRSGSCQAILYYVYSRRRRKAPPRPSTGARCSVVGRRPGVTRRATELSGSRPAGVAFGTWQSLGVPTSSSAIRGRAAAFLPAHSRKPDAWVVPRSISGDGRKCSGRRTSACEPRTSLTTPHMCGQFSNSCA